MVLPVLIIEAHDQVRGALAQRLRHRPDVMVLAAIVDVPSAVPLLHSLKPDLVLSEPKTGPRHHAVPLRELVETGQPIIVWASSLHRGRRADPVHGQLALAHRRTARCQWAIGKAPGLARAHRERSHDVAGDSFDRIGAVIVGRRSFNGVPAPRCTPGRARHTRPQCTGIQCMNSRSRRVCMPLSPAGPSSVSQRHSS